MLNYYLINFIINHKTINCMSKKDVFIHPLLKNKFVYFSHYQDVNTEVVKLLDGKFAGLEIVAVEESDAVTALNRVVDRKVKWKKDKPLNDWIKEPKNLMRIEQDIMTWHAITKGEWFTPKDIVKSGYWQGSYKDFFDFADALHYLGFLAIRKEDNGANNYKALPTPIVKTDYIRDSITIKEEEVRELKAYLDSCQVECKKYTERVIAHTREILVESLKPIKTKTELYEFLKDKNLFKDLNKKLTLAQMKKSILEEYDADSAITMDEYVDIKEVQSQYTDKELELEIVAPSVLGGEEHLGRS